MSDSVPAGWELKPLGEFCLGIRGVSYKPSDLSLNSSSDTITLLRSNNIQDNGILLEDVQHVSCNRVKDQQKAQKNDIAVCMSNGSKRLVGKSASFRNMPKNGVYTVGAFCSIFRVNNNAHPEFVFQLFQSQPFSSQVSLSLAGSAINNLKNTDVEEYCFLKPPLPEQQKIASILTSVDTVIEKTEAQINKLKDLKKAMMQELLTKGIGHTEFKDSPVGRIPVEWEVQQLKVLFPKIVVGYVGNVNNYYCDSRSGVPFYRTLNVRDGFFTHNNLKYVTRGFNDRNKKSQIFNNDILIARVGANLGMTCKVTGLNEVANIANTIIIKSSQTANSDFYTEFLCSGIGQRQILLGSAGGAQGVFNTNLAQTLIVPVPPLSEQQKIASISASVDTGIVEIQNKLSHTKSLKKALMQDLLTGKVRVAV
jgi:type I restriction enzyme, S subunit